MYVCILTAYRGVCAPRQSMNSRQLVISRPNRDQSAHRSLCIPAACICSESPPEQSEWLVWVARL